MKTDFTNLNGLAKELHLPVKWLKVKAVEGQIPCLRVGRHFRFNIKAVRSTLLKMAAEKGASNDH